jgi:asparagine synthase (glutamine-hydrolysing)
MCGIAGYVRRQGPADEAIVAGMCSAITHRGPDDQGIHVDGGCAIGMRRLSIIDLSTGHQPMSNEDGTVWVVFNGEIYTYLHIRAELESRGHRFRTRSDTETLVHLYEEWGAEGVSRLGGMFAFAIWDAPRRRLLLARDRLGKKPVYYADTPEGFYFASEIKSLRAAGVPLSEDREALRWYFLLGYLPDPLTAFQGVRKLPPGAWLVWDQETGRITTESYWKVPRFTGQAPDFDYQDSKARLASLFDECVRERLIADVPLGAFLSGGIDSSLVVASMARQTAEPVKTFSIGFEEAEYNETGYARQVAEQYGTDHHEIMVRPDSVGLVHRLVRHFDEPFADSSAIPTFLVSEFAARSVKVVLSGDGGDEFFGGYRSFFVTRREQRWDRAPRPLRRVAGWAFELLPYATPGKNFLRMATRLTPADRYFELSYAHHSLRKRLLQPEWMLPSNLERAIFTAFPDTRDGADADPLAQAMYFEATSKLTGDILVKVDRMSMAASLEVRCPLLDHRMVEFACAVPHDAKMGASTGKRILLDALGDRLPPALLNRPKKGFSVPLPIWFRTSMRELLRDTLLGGGSRLREIARPEFVAYLIDEHERQRRNNSHWLWLLLVLELWLREQAG